MTDTDPHRDYRRHLVDRQTYLPIAAQLPLRPDNKVPGPAGPKFHVEQLRRIIAVLDALNGLGAIDPSRDIAPLAAADVLIPIFDTESGVEDDGERVPLGWLHAEDEDAWVFVPAHSHEELTDLLHGHAIARPRPVKVF